MPSPSGAFEPDQQAKQRTTDCRPSCCDTKRKQCRGTQMEKGAQDSPAEDGEYPGAKMRRQAPARRTPEHQSMHSPEDRPLSNPPEGGEDDVAKDYWGARNIEQTRRSQSIPRANTPTTTPPSTRP